MTPIKIYDKPLMPLPALVAAIDAGELDATFEALGSAGGTASGARGGGTACPSSERRGWGGLAVGFGSVIA